MIDELSYLYGKPTSHARLKSEFSDFQVVEELGFQLSGEGEFVVIRLRKTNCNTVFVGEKLAAFAGISVKHMGYAGLKDRHAVTEQSICLHMPGKETPDFSQFALEGVEILDVTRHNRKIRIGSLDGNHFKILLRDLSESDELKERLDKISRFGFPNYFTAQRFGHNGKNLDSAERWGAGEIKVRERYRRSLYLSAARSYLYNLLVSQRIKSGLFHQVLVGDVLQLAGSHSHFVAIEEELSDLQRRLEEQDLFITAPLAGDDSGVSQDEVAKQERAVLDSHPNLQALLAKEKVKSARRAANCIPEQLSYTFEEQGLSLSFFLPSGSYATALVRELALVE